MNQNEILSTPIFIAAIIAAYATIVGVVLEAVFQNNISPVAGITTVVLLTIACIFFVGYCVQIPKVYVAKNQNSPSIPDDFISIQGGTFIMGSPSSEVDRCDDEAQHRVTVRGFYMGRYEITQKEYEEVMGCNPSEFMGAILPVENVSWYDAVEYCNKRSKKEGLHPVYTIDKSRFDPKNYSPAEFDTIWWLVTVNQNANGYRLPTEAEWEYACRAGSAGPFSTGNNIITSQANYDGTNPYKNNAKGVYRKKTTTVGSFASNPWGLYDMHGNVWEWCWDWYGKYNTGTQTDPRGAASGFYRVLRGGGWNSHADNLRSAFRNFESASGKYTNCGFRIARNAE
ncbi:hypothetical protein FACS1894137_12510 [Spirochaetia bacterium]|nr:hypothetical protein FACS1894137_12510 [Spirochaetia bacterium]